MPAGSRRSLAFYRIISSSLDGEAATVGTTEGFRPMDISSVSSATPVAPVDTSSSQPQAQAAGASNNSSYQPPPKAPLPPGQGTRVDQLA
jgi:hypothetical protein